MYVLCGDAHYEDREKTSGQIGLINILIIGAMDKTFSQPQVMLSLLNSNSLKYLRSVLMVLIAVSMNYSMVTAFLLA
jgi:hypothetical protein